MISTPQHVSEVIIGAPYTVTEFMLNSLKVLHYITSTLTQSCNMIALSLPQVKYVLQGSTKVYPDAVSYRCMYSPRQTYTYIHTLYLCVHGRGRGLLPGY